MVLLHGCNQRTFAAEENLTTDNADELIYTDKPKPIPIKGLKGVAFLAISRLFNLPTYQITHLPTSA